MPRRPRYDHPGTRVGFSSTYNATILDGCLSCHAAHTADYGNYFADATHVARYGSTTFMNHSGAYGEEDLYDTSRALTLTGVKNPTTFACEELAAVPQEEVTATNQCVVAGSAGHNIYNATYAGVSLKTLVELCGAWRTA